MNKSARKIFEETSFTLDQMSDTKCHHEILQQYTISPLPGKSHTPPTYETAADDLKQTTTVHFKISTNCSNK